MHRLTRNLEALLFTAPRPVSIADATAATGAAEAAVVSAFDELGGEYAPGRHGLELRELGGGYTFAVAPESEAAVRAYSGARPPDDLSPALLETLSVVCYLQPVTRAEVAHVRGVSSEWALAALVERGLIEESGRADTPGAPIIYGTTERFLRLFGLRSVAELPPLEEFALGAKETEEIRARLLANAERRSP